jgi:acetyl-CoA carboxylase carboxyltransferase component
VAESEQQAFAMIRRFLSYLPSNVWELPPRIDCGDPAERQDEALIEIIPRNPRQAYNMRKLVGMVVDRGSEFEIQPTFGRAVITMLARMDGHVVGIVDSKAARKQGHFVELCDMFNIPLVFFADLPGFAIGKEAEESAVLREGVRARYIGLQVNVPVFSVIVRRCYGMAGGSAIDRRGLNFKVAWPSAEWGSLPLEGGVRAAYKREIEKAADPVQKEKELEAELRRLNSPFLTAEGFGIEDLIDPRETRPYLCRFLNACQPRLRSQVGPKPKLGVRPLESGGVTNRTTPLRPSRVEPLLHGRGESNLPLLVEEGWHEVPGWSGSSRRGGAQRRGGQQ